MSGEELASELEQRNPIAQLLEPRDHLDKCIVALTDSPDDEHQRTPGVLVAVYDADLLIEALYRSGKCLTMYDARDWFWFNIHDAWTGDGTPTFTSEHWEKDSNE